MKTAQLLAVFALSALTACDQLGGPSVGTEGAVTTEPSPTEVAIAEIPTPKPPSCESATSCITQRSRPYTPEEVSGLMIQKAELSGNELRVALSNLGGTDILPQATDGSTLKLAWGYAPADAQHPGYFTTRYEWVEPLRPGQNLQLTIPLEVSKPNSGEALWVVLLQEDTFWLHDSGVSAVAADIVDSR